MAINNPLRVRTERILGRTSSGVYFEGTNTGAFGWLVSDLGCDECIELNDPGFIPFGGKAVHAPALGRFLAGSALHELGIPFDCRKIRGDQPQSGEVIHIDNFGNAKLFLNSKLFASVKPGTPLFVDTPRAGIIQALYAARMMSLSDGEWVVYPGSSLGLLEMGQVRCPGVLQIDLAVGDTVRITL